jgi:hypothetical protein
MLILPKKLAAQRAHVTRILQFMTVKCAALQHELTQRKECRRAGRAARLVGSLRYGPSPFFSPHWALDSRSVGL